MALAMVPEGIGFALIAQVSPLTGLYAVFIVSLVTSILGGRPRLISGATGALAVVMVALVVQHGIEYLFAAVVMMGLLQNAPCSVSFSKKCPHLRRVNCGIFFPKASPGAFCNSPMIVAVLTS